MGHHSDEAFQDLCLHRLLSLFLCKEHVPKVVPCILETFYIFEKYAVIINVGVSFMISLRDKTLKSLAFGLLDFRVPTEQELTKY
jgi:hypothetical protein